MSDIFVSYSHHDSDRARAIASALEARGWSVWWDPVVRSGESFVSIINREINTASFVVVLWSKRSVTSRWVLEEALYGLNHGILCPIMIEHDVQLPVGFATIKYVALWDWQDDAPVGGYNHLIAELDRLFSAAASDARPPVVVEEAYVSPAPPPAPPVVQAKQAEEPSAAPVVEPIAAPAEEPRAAPAVELAPGEDRYIDFSDLNWAGYAAIGLFFAAFIAFVGFFFGRFLIGASSLSGETLALAALIIASFFGAVIAERNGRSIRSPASLRFSGRLFGYDLSLAYALASSGVYAATAYVLAMKTAQAYSVNEIWESTGIPLFTIAAALTLAFAAMASSSLSRMVTLSRRKATA